MKNLILGATSILAIGVVCAAKAQTLPPATSPAPASNPTAPMSKPTAPAPAPLLAPGAPPAKVIAPAAPSQKPMMPQAQASKMKPLMPLHAPQPKHHHQAHKKHHHKHHPRHMTPTAEAHVMFPPAQGCALEYYWGTLAYPYVYYGGYFWYPHNNATALTGYVPSYWNGYYWYASRMHPHMLYIEGQGASYVIPLDITGRRG